MCGIAGFATFAADATEYGVVYTRMLDTLRHRGPDGNGTYLSPRACLIHTRLAVVDLENGAQPMVQRKHDDDTALVYNGELYNTNELRRELTLRGHDFRGHSDTEVVLNAYLEWGEQCVDRFNGIYAFAVWDARRQALFLARDRMGVKPLFFCRVGEGMLFASEIKALLCHPRVKAEIDSGGIAELLLLGPGATPGCGVFRGIREIEPGCCATFTGRGLDIRPYWRLEAREHRESFGETVERVGFLVGDAIRRQTVSDVPLCAFLSGGLDSSIIAALSGVEETFSVAYAENERYFRASAFQPDSDDKYIRLMTEHLGTKHTTVTLESDELADALPEAVEARDLPGMADVDSSLLLFCRRVRENATVALSGECADELFGGYPWYRNPEIREGEGFPWSRSTRYRAGFLQAGALGDIDPVEYVRQKYAGAVAEADTLPGEQALERRMKEMFTLNVDWFMQTLLTRKDRMSMHSALEVRVPFCDHRLTEYLYNVPWAYKDHEGREKGLLRKAVEGILPAEVLWRKKSPYPKTHHPAYLKRVREMLAGAIADPAAPLLQLVKKSALEELLRDDNATPWYGQLMTTPQTIAYFVQLDYWLRRYKVGIV